MTRMLRPLATLALLSLLFSIGCASAHNHQQAGAGYLSEGDTGGGWATIQNMTAPP